MNLRRSSLPRGLSFAGTQHAAADVRFLADVTWVDPDGSRHSSQQIFDAAFDMISRARRLVLLDVFLYNDFEMRVPDPVRPLTRELTDLLVSRKRENSEIRIVVITDPINTVYGSLRSEAFARLRDAGVEVVMTDLHHLRDSNPLYSAFWRLLIKPFGNADGGRLRNPFDPRGRVTLRSMLEMLNFKANHRKVLITDSGDRLAGLVMSANPHDASSAHVNVACRFGGRAVEDLLRTENAVLEFSGAAPIELRTEQRDADGEVTVQVMTEKAIKTATMRLLNELGHGETLDIATLYLADRDVIAALKQCAGRGIQLRVLLDPNKDAFGHRSYGIPNRSVAAELKWSGVTVRWSHTHGEQCHNKMMLGMNGMGRAKLLLGSANFTRRNLEDFNLETSVVIRAPVAAAIVSDARTYFDTLWHNRPDQVYSVPYEHYRDESLVKRGLYRFMEASGMCTF